MSDVLEERVVKLKFDNAQFKENIRDTIRSLEDLENSLQFEEAADSAGAIQKAVNAVNFDAVDNAIEKTKSGFNALEVVARTVLSNITTRAMNAGESLIKSLSIDQVTTGWSKYEEKTGNIQTLVNSTGKTAEEINGYLSKLMWYSDETSYGFTDMTSALSTMVASGGDIANLIPMIEGMANATAYAGKGAAEFKRIIYNLNQSYGQGYLSLMDWKSVELAGAGSKKLKEILIETAEEVGTVEKGLMTIENFSTELSNKYITSEVMEKAFGKFATLTEGVYEAVNNGEFNTAAQAIEALAGSYDEVAVRAFQSAQEAKSFKEAIDATKDAVSSTWMKIFENIFGSYDEAKTLWTQLANDLYDLFVPGLDAKAELLAEWHVLDDGGYKDFVTGAIALFQGFKNIIEAVSDALSHVFPPTTVEALQNFTRKFKIVGEKFQEITSYISPFTNAVSTSAQAIEATAETATSAISEVKDEAELLLEIANNVINGNYGNGQDRIAQLTKLGYSYEIVQNKVNELLGSTKRYNTTGKTLITTESKLVDATEEVSESTTEASDTFIDLVSSAQAATTEVEKTSETLSQKLAWTVSGVASAVSILAEAVKAVMKVIAIPFFTTVIPIILDKILTLTSSIGKKVTELAEFIKANNTFTNFLQKVVDIFMDVKDVIEETIKKAQGLESVETFLQNISTLWSNLGQIKNNFVSKFSELIKSLNTNVTFGDFKSSAIEALVNLLNLLFKGLNNILTILEPVNNAIFKFLQTIASNINFNAISNGLQALGNQFKKLGDVISTFWTALTKSDFFSTLKFKIKNTFIGLLPNTIKTLRTYWIQFKSLFTNIVGDFGKATTKVSATTSVFSGATKSLRKTFSSFFKDIKTTVSPAIKQLSPMFEKLGEAFDIFKSVFSSINIKAILGIAGQIGELYVIYKTFKSIWTLTESITKIVQAAANVLTSITGILNSIKGMFSSIGKMFNDIGSSALKISNSVSMLSFATSIFILVSAIGILTNLDQSKLYSAVAVIAILGGIVGGLAFLMSKIASNKIQNSAAGTAMIVAFALGLIAMVYALSKLSSLLKDSDNVISALILLAALMGMLLGAVVAMNLINQKISQTNWPDTISNAIMLLAYASALKKVIEALDMLTQYEFLAIQKAMFELLEVMVVMAIIAYAAKGLKVTNSISLVALVGSIWLMCKVLESIAGMDFTTIKNNIDKLVIVFASIFILSAAARVAGQGALGLGAMMLALGLSLVSIAFAMKIIAGMGEREVATAGLVISGIIIAIGLFIKLATKVVDAKSKITSSALVVLALGITLAMIAVAMQIIANIDAEGCIRAIAAIGVALAGIAAVASQADKLQNSLKGFIGIAVVLVFISTSLYILSTIDFESLKAATAALSAVILSIAAMAYSIGKMDTSIKGAISTILILGTMLALVTAALYVLTTYTNTDKMLAAAESLSLVLLALSVSTFILSKIKTNIKSAIDIAGSMLIFVGAVGLIFAALAGIVTAFPNIVETMETVGDLLEAVGSAIGKLIGGVIGGLAEGITDSLPAVAENIKQFCDVLNDIPDNSEEKMNAVSNLLTAFGSLASAGLKNQFSDMMSTLTGKNGMRSVLEELLGSDNKEGIIDQLITFVKDCDALNDETNTEKIKVITDIMTALVDCLETFPKSGGLLQGITGQYNWSTLSEGLAEMGSTLRTFVNSTKNIGEHTEGTEAAVSVMKNLVSILQEVPEDNGILENWVGKHNWSTLSTGLTAMGIALATFAMTVKDIGKYQEGMDAAVPIMRDLSEALEHVPSIGGIVQKWFSGSVNWSTLSDGLIPLATSLYNFGKALEPIMSDVKSGWTAINEATIIIQKMAVAIERIQNVENSAADVGATLFTGWARFSNGLQDFVTEICAAAEIAEGTSEFLIDKLVRIVEAVTSINLDANAFSVGNQANGLIALGKAIKEFMQDINEFSGYNANDSNNKSAPTSFLTQMVQDIQQFGNDMLNLDMTNFENFGANITNAIMTGMQRVPAMLSMDGIDTSTSSGGVVGNGFAGMMSNFLSTVVARFQENLETFESLGEQIGISMSTGLSSEMPLQSLTTSTKTIIDTVGTGINTTYADNIKTIGKNFVNIFINGLTDAKTSLANLQTASKRLCTTIVRTISDQYQSFYDIGAYVVQGLINGMNSKLEAVKAAARAIGEAATVTVQTTTGVNSPSKITTYIGEMLGEGLVVGMHDSLGKVGHAGEDLGSTTIKSIKGIVSSLDNLGNINTSRITPVFDLSKAANEISSLNTAISRNSAINANSSFSLNAQTDDFSKLVALTSQMLDSIQNGGNVYLDENILVGRINRRLGQL